MAHNLSESGEHPNHNYSKLMSICLSTVSIKITMKNFIARVHTKSFKVEKSRFLEKLSFCTDRPFLVPIVTIGSSVFGTDRPFYGTDLRFGADRPFLRLLLDVAIFKKKI